jgi:hypothetical protein
LLDEALSVYHIWLKKSNAYCDHLIEERTQRQPGSRLPAELLVTASFQPTKFEAVSLKMTLGSLTGPDTDSSIAAHENGSQTVDCQQRQVLIVEEEFQDAEADSLSQVANHQHYWAAEEPLLAIPVASTVD